MKQLLIVNSAKAINANTGTSVTPYDLSVLDKGAIAFFELGASSLLSTAATKNFAIALGRGANSNPIIIPEVDINSLTIVKSLPKLGVAFARKFTFPTPVVGKDYGVLLIKKGTVPHERNTWYCAITAGSTTAGTEAEALKKVIEAKLGDKFTVSRSTAALTITAKVVGEQWEMKFTDNLAGTSLTTPGSNDAEKTIGDKAYIEDLASQCAAGKGFNYVYGDGKDIYPNYPEAVEDLVPNTSGDQGASTAGYVLYTLRFKVGRDSSKTRDEQVWQLVHIAVPINNASISTINAILPEGYFPDNKNSAATSAAITAAAEASASNG